MSLTETFLAGNRRRYTAVFRVPDADGALTDPDTVTFYRRQLGVAAASEAKVFGADEEVLRDSLGQFHIDFDYPTAGSFAVGVAGTGACHAYDELEVVVTQPQAH